MYLPTALPTPPDETNGAEISATGACSFSPAAPSRSISVLACAPQAKPLLMLAALIACFTFAGEAQAGLLVTAEESSSMQSVADDAAPTVPDEATPLERQREHVGDSSHDALPSGTGAGSGGVSSGASVTAVLDTPSAPLSPSALSASLEERHLSLPASPVFDRLRPPRG